MQVTQIMLHSVMNMMAENVAQMTENGAIIVLTIAHELEPKKWVFGSGGWAKYNINFQSPQDVYILEKYDGLSKQVPFGQKLKYFTDRNGLKEGLHENEL